MSDITKTKAKMKMIDLGIVPALSGEELVRMMSSLTKEEQRVAKRKFRKVWRKMSKSNKEFNHLNEEKGKIPDENTLKNRSRMVATILIRQSY